MNIEKKESGRTGKIFIYEDNEEVADLAYMINDENNYVIDHTSVNDDMSGKGLGMKLIETMVEMARENNKKIIPGCRFAKKVFERNKEKYADIWDKRE